MTFWLLRAIFIEVHEKKFLKKDQSKERVKTRPHTFFLFFGGN